jgi:hypothetical protein
MEGKMKKVFLSAFSLVLILSLVIKPHETINAVVSVPSAAFTAIAPEIDG